MSGKGGQTVGYHYLFTIIAGLGRGPVDVLRQIEVNEKIAWDSHACDDSPQVINEPELFGGEGKEGGIQGGFRLLQGAQDQVLPGDQSVSVGSSGPVKSTTIPGVKNALGGLVSEFRGFSAVIFDGLIASMNPYIKEWKFRVQRTRAGWHNDEVWYPARAAIWLGDGQIMAMNPAHIIYQCLTDPNWGKGEPPETIDENSFIYAANLFCSEGMGLCIPWYRQEDVDSFIQVVCDHVAAVVDQDRTTGKYVLRALRDDYDPETIPHFDFDSGLLEIEEDDSASSEAVNEVIVTGFDPLTRQDYQVRAQNIAGWHAHGGPISRPMEFKGLPTRELGLRAAQRELRLLSAGLKKFRVKLDRRAWQLAPGAVFRMSSAEHNISNMVVRIGEMTEGASNGERAIVAKVMEDVYSLPDTTFTSASESTWTPPIVDPVPAPAERLIEMGYRDLYRLIGPGDLGSADDADTGIGTLAISPGSGSYLYDLASKAQGESEFSFGQSRDYTGSAVLTNAVAPLDTSFVLQDLYEFDEDSVGEMFLLEDEEVYLTAWDSGTSTATFIRGCSDTLPADHAAGARLFSLDDDLVSDGRTYLAGETALAKVLPRTGSKVLPVDDATELSLTLAGRQARPYPPADLQINAVSVFEHSGQQNDPVFTWAHRDRVLQEDQAVGHEDASIGPESGTTYTFRIYDINDTLIRTESGLTGLTWTYDSAMQASDSATPVVRVEFESVRDGLASYQRYSFLVVLDLLTADTTAVTADSTAYTADQG